MIELITRKFRIEEMEDTFLCEAYIRKMPGYMELSREGTLIIAHFTKKVM